MENIFKTEESAKNINDVIFTFFLVLAIILIFYSFIYTNPLTGDSEFNFYYSALGLISLVTGLTLKVIINLLIEISKTLKTKAGN